MIITIGFVEMVACSGDTQDPDAPRAIAPLLQLSPTLPEDDSFPEHRPESIECNNLTGWYIEDSLLEVDTGRCNYLSLVEPAALGAPAGTMVTTEISHFDLTSPEPASAHIALSIKGVVMWERTIAVPSPADVLSLSFELPVDVEKGDPVEFHVHNHGQNTWNFAPIQLAAR